MKGDWIFDASRGDWHLVARDNDDKTTITWCHRVLPGDAQRKAYVTEINGLFEAIHDECYRKSEELTNKETEHGG